MKHLGTITLMTGSLLLTSFGIASCADDVPNIADSAASEYDTAPADSDAEVYDPFTQKPQFADLNEFTATTLDGGSFTAADWADADVTAVNIWSTTCGPCIREMPELAEYAASLPENLRVMTWCLDAAYVSESTDIGAFMEECGFTGITLVSGDGDLNTLYGQLLYTPTTVFVDSEGNMVAEPIIGAGSIAEQYDARFASALKSLGIASE